MPDQRPYVEATEHLAVRALIRDTRHGAVVLGWRGDRTYLTWRTDMGNHLGVGAGGKHQRVETESLRAPD